MSEYSKVFSGKKARLRGAPGVRNRGTDFNDGTIYVCNPETARAVRVAMATGRPLLLAGSPGSGKSSLASYVAREMGWNYFEHVVTSRTQAEDLQYSIDDVRRLRDANIGKLVDDLRAYLEPGVLWWAFNPSMARYRGFEKKEGTVESDALPPGVLRNDDVPNVLLLDEIDKAEPDVPNDCLVALGSRRFFVRGTNTVVESCGPEPPLVLITTNQERTLPPAFLRRCIVHTLPPQGVEALCRIAEAHFPKQKRSHRDVFLKLAQKIMSERDSQNRSIWSPNTAEFLDAVQACVSYDITPGDDSELWRTIESAVLRKAPEL